jgi:hypothetical protein
MIGSVTHIYGFCLICGGVGGELPKREVSKSSGMKQLTLVTNISGREAQEATVTEPTRLFSCAVARILNLRARSCGSASDLYSGGV